ncbi:MAG: class I SAM-dependent methyltransferase [Acidimicrobiales bacterium]
MSYDGRGLRFGSVAEQYDLYRPSPPPEVASILGVLDGFDVLEVGAGTGKWTRRLLELGAVVTVVEPDPDMLAVLVRRSPEVNALQGAAEALPVEDASFDAALVSSAWHWFEQPAATLEMARVLRDGGRLFVLWNGFSRNVPWLDAITALRERPDDVHKRPRGWGADFGSDSGFEIESEVRLDWTWSRRVDELVAVFGTYSGAIIRTDEDREEMEREVRAHLEARAIDGVVEIPMTVRGTVAKRKIR